MNPQDPFVSQNQTPTQPVVGGGVPTAPMQSGPVMSPMASGASGSVAPSSSGGKKWLVIVIIVVVLALLAGGFVAYTMMNGGSSKTNLTYTKEKDANLGPLKVGEFNYVNACDAFTADDLDAVTSKTSNRMQVNVQYA